MNFLWIDEKENAIDSLEKCLEFLRKVEEDWFYWKWVIISLHNALYGFMICILTQGNYDNVLRSTKKYQKLIDFDKALRCVQTREYVRGYDIKPIQLTCSQKKSVSILKNVLRNNFEHFVPKGWYIELGGMQDIIRDITEIIESLLLLGPAVVPFEEEQIKRIEFFLKSIKSIKINL